MLRRNLYSIGWLAAIVLSFNTLSAAAPSLVGQAFPQIESTENVSKEPANPDNKIVLYDFWASWCPPCKASFPVMERLMNDYGTRGFTVIAINEDEKTTKMNRFLKRQNISFPIVQDKGHAIIETLKVKTMPTAFLVDRKGIIRSVHQGFHERSSEQAYRKAIEALLNER